MVHHFIGNPHKTEYEDIDEDFSLSEEFIDNGDSSDYEEEDEDDDFEEEEEEEDDEEYENDDDEYADYWDVDSFLSGSDNTSDIYIPPGLPNAGHIGTEGTEDILKEENTSSTEKESPESKVAEDLPTIHRNIENNSET